MYRSVETGIWTDPKFKKLKNDDRQLFIYFLTSPHSHFSGIYYLPMALICYETGLSQKTVSMGIECLSDGHLIAYDGTLEVVWVRNMLKHQGQNENILKGISKYLRTLHNTPLIEEFIKYYDTNGIPIKYPSGWVSMQLQEQEQEQEQEQLQESVSPPEKFDPEGPEVRLSQLLYDLIKKNNPSAQPKPDGWPKYVRTMLNAGRTPEQIGRVIEWCQNDHGSGGEWPGWAVNIQSMKKVHIQFDRLTSEMQGGKRDKDAEGMQEYLGRLEK